VTVLPWQTMRNAQSTKIKLFTLSLESISADSSSSELGLSSAA
jgi:hypothetical protein